MSKRSNVNQGARSESFIGACLSAAPQRWERHVFCHWFLCGGSSPPVSAVNHASLSAPHWANQSTKLQEDVDCFRKRKKKKCPILFFLKTVMFCFVLFSTICISGTWKTKSKCSCQVVLFAECGVHTNYTCCLSDSEASN